MGIGFVLRRRPIRQAMAELFSEWLGNGAGLYLGTVLYCSLPGVAWQLGEHGRPLVVLRNGLELDVTEIGHSWAGQGSPQLAVTYPAATDG